MPLTNTEIGIIVSLTGLAFVIIGKFAIIAKKTYRKARKMDKLHNDLNHIHEHRGEG